MELTKQKMPLYAKVSLICIAAYAMVILLYIGQEIIVPLVFSALFSILLNPVVLFFQRYVPRIVAIILAIFLAVLLVVGIVYAIGMQLTMFWEKFPVFEQRFNVFLNDTVNWVSKTFDIRKQNVNHWLEQTKSDFIKDGGQLIGSTISTLSSMLIVCVLIPIYVLMMLYYLPLFDEFILRVCPKNRHATVAEMISESKLAMQNYLTGLLLETLIVSGLNVAGLLILRIDYAILLGIMGGLLNIIPYIGGVVAIALPMLIAMVTKDSYSYSLWVVITYTIIQFIDNNLIVPKVVASRVQINALVSVVVVLIGGALWGVSGMFLSIPLTAVVKIIFDRINSLKPYGYLLGDTMPYSRRSILQLLKKKIPAQK